MTITGPHQNQPVVAAGKPLAQARAAVILVHGRGATAESILELAEELYHPDVAYLAPQAAGNTWYPYSFLSPIPQNEPGISSGLAALAALLERVVVAGIPYERIVLGGFSQGACLATEFVARNARRYGGVLDYSGGLIGPPGTPRDYQGSLAGTPVFLGCSDVDPHIPKERVQETADVLTRLGGQVTMRLYPGMGHMINQEEVEAGRRIVEGVIE
ncbi:MAG: alpha/beta hydrolase [Chloroflexi bacterium]|nr:alpha/beta hydrolase [Chloroflexota bacterium]MCI0575474.1 alpha/beta hydrolase [Chloroflexota bacterium]